MRRITALSPRSKTFVDENSLMAFAELLNGNTTNLFPQSRRSSDATVCITCHSLVVHLHKDTHHNAFTVPISRLESFFSIREYTQGLIVFRVTLWAVSAFRVQAIAWHICMNTLYSVLCISTIGFKFSKLRHSALVRSFSQCATFFKILWVNATYLWTKQVFQKIY